MLTDLLCINTVLFSRGTTAVTYIACTVLSFVIRHHHNVCYIVFPSSSHGSVVYASYSTRCMKYACMAIDVFLSTVSVVHYHSHL